MCGGSEVDAEGDAGPDRPTLAKPRCTDVLWLIIFVVFLALLVIIGVFAFVYGNPQRVINGFDTYGNTCGVKSNPKITSHPNSGISTIDKPYLLFMDLKHPRKSLKICVKRCPKKTMNTTQEVIDYYKETGVNLCNYNVDLNNPKKNEIENNLNGPCPALPIYNSKSILHRCVPKRIDDITKELFGDVYSMINKWEGVDQIFSDIYASWKELLIFSFVALVISFIMVSILHLLATIVSWIFMIVVSISSVCGSGLLWYTFYEIRKENKSTPIEETLSQSLRNQTAFMWYAIIATIITIIILLLVFVMRKRVAFLAALFKETASCLGSIPGLFIQPIVTFIFLMLFFMSWVVVIVCLATSSHPAVRKNTDITPTVATPTSDDSPKNISLSGFVDFVDESWIKGMWWVYLIGFVWVSEFILACQQMTIAGAVSQWYFRGPHADSSPVMYSIGKLLKYHIGSVAKGSFLITLFKVPRLIMMYLHAKLTKSADKGSDCAKCGLKCGICCFYCLEKFIAFLNHNAYTIIAIESVHFCKAAGIAFTTLMSNALQLITINSVGDFILFLGKCTVTAVTGSIGLIVLKRNTELHFYAAPTLVICVFAFFISHCILSLYEMVVDTLFICVCEDRKLNGAEGRWNHSGLATFATDSPARKSKSAQNDTQPGTEMQALQS